MKILVGYLDYRSVGSVELGKFQNVLVDCRSINGDMFVLVVFFVVVCVIFIFDRFYVWLFLDNIKCNIYFRFEFLKMNKFKGIFL